MDILLKPIPKIEIDNLLILCNTIKQSIKIQKIKKHFLLKNT